MANRKSPFKITPTKILVGLFTILFIWVLWDNLREMMDHEMYGWTYCAHNPIIVACMTAQEKGVKVTNEPYWGPFTPQIADRIGLNNLYIIDPFNLDPPKSKWLSIVDPNTAWSVKIKGNPIWLYSNGSNMLMLIARGPDGVQNVTMKDAQLAEKFHDPTKKDLPGLAFDPTNGTYSGGDIFRLVIIGEPTSQTTTAAR